ncbi:MAG: polyketide synthase, partial [Boseongicola sp. SB0673_bin_14]|nr:polyketide synthase [Boseongicola sp. SB0673_bin_14]
MREQRKAAAKNPCFRGWRPHAISGQRLPPSIGQELDREERHDAGATRCLRKRPNGGRQASASDCRLHRAATWSTSAPGAPGPHDPDPCADSRNAPLFRDPNRSLRGPNPLSQRKVEAAPNRQFQSHKLRRDILWGRNREDKLTSSIGTQFNDFEAFLETMVKQSKKKKTSRRAEPIAVVGMACRFPGAPDIRSFWHLLESGGNSVLDGLPGSGPNRLEELFNDPLNLQGACRYCAYVDDIDQFDAGFFRISPVEAELLDPQQRMMLETSWQALEDAGMDPDRLKESLTGVYTGISNDEYRMLVVDSERPGEAAESLYALSGTNLNGTSGRVSFVMGFM